MHGAPSTGTGKGVGILTGLVVYFGGLFVLVQFLSSTDGGSAIMDRVNSWPVQAQAVFGISGHIAFAVGGYALAGIARRFVDSRIAMNGGRAGSVSMVAGGLGWLAIGAGVVIAILAFLVMFVALIAFGVLFGLVGLFAITSD